MFLRRLAVLCSMLFLLGTPAAIRSSCKREERRSSTPPASRSRSAGSASGTGLCWKAISGVSAASARRKRNLSWSLMICWDPLMRRSSSTTGVRTSCPRRTFIASSKTDSTPSEFRCTPNTSRPMTMKGFKLIDQLSKWCRQEHLYVILMLESGVGGFTGEASDDGPGYPWLLKDAGMQEYVSEAWQRIANHYKDDPTILGYDLLNEPLLWNGYLDMESLIEPEYRRLTEAIRKVDTHHMLILQPPLGRFSAFGKPFDNNTVYSFHSYSATPRPEFLQQYLDFRTKYQVPIFFSEIYTERAPEWSTAHVNLAEKYNIGWMIWPYKKMAGDTTGPYTFPSPADWPKIILFAHQPRDDRAVRDRNALRPPQKDTDAMFAEILENEKNEHVTVHPEYLDLPGVSAH